MKNRLMFIFGIFSVIFLSSGIFSYMVSQVQYTQFSSPSTISAITPNLNQAVCTQGTDFLLQISPTGCSPTIVRSDLLEQNDVPVLCQLAATQVNPLITVNAINTISFSGTYPPEVSGIGFEPAQAALGVQGALNSPVLGNIGYVVIVLKKQPNDSAMPAYVSGNLTANLQYNIQNAFGIGNAMFYIPQTNEQSWAANMNQYSFWEGRGSLMVNDIEPNSADISVYSGTQKISEVNLQKGQTSNSTYLPGFSCQAGLELQLVGLTNPATMARLSINSNIVDVIKGGTFLDNKCQVQDLSQYGLLQMVTLTCNEDSGISHFSLTISPKVILNVNGTSNTYGLGDWLYDIGSMSVYLGYIGTNGDSNNQNDLYVYLVSSPIKESKLSDTEIASISSLIGGLINAKATSSGLVSSLSVGLKSFAGVSNLLARFISNGEDMYRINFGGTSSGILGPMTSVGVPLASSAFTVPVSILSFAGAQNVQLSGDVNGSYGNATSDYDTLRNQFVSEPFGTNSTFGEEASYNEIVLAWNAGQLQTVLNLCSNFAQNYPNSNKDLSNYCNNSYQLSNSGTSSAYVTVDKQAEQISFDGIYEPSFSDFGAIVSVTTPNGTQYFDLADNQINYLDAKSSDYVQLVGLSNDTAQIATGISAVGVMNEIIKQFNSDVVTLKLNTPVSFVGGYSFTLSKINLNQLAQVSVIPNINNAGTQANFSFEIPIEQRSIDLTPEQIKQLMAGLNQSISQWTSISNTLGNVTQTLKTACLITGAALTAENFLENAGGAGIARQDVMTGKGGWNQKCAALVANQTYISLDQCFSANSNQIDSDVSAFTTAINNQNLQVQQLQQGSSTQQGLTTNVNTNAFMQQFAPQVSNAINNLPGTNITDPSGVGKSIDKTAILTDLSYQGYKNSIYTTAQLQDIDLYATILASANGNSDLQQIAGQGLYSDLSAVQTNSGNFAQLSSLANSFGINPSQVTALQANNTATKEYYSGLTNKDLGANEIPGFSDSNPIAIVESFPDGGQYIVVLNSTTATGTSLMPIALLPPATSPSLAIYSMSGILVSNPPTDLKKMYFVTVNSASYHNTYKNPELTYYATAPYQGMPAIVPFDLVNGWYAATVQTLPTGGSSSSPSLSYEASARVNSFYLCNVGPNGLEEFQNTGGDDICELINTGTGQAYNQFPGLTQQQATTEISQAVQAIQQATTLYKPGLSGKVKILNAVVNVGPPASNTPQYECQDFMSPKDCLTLFNVCDPVICPSSRCNLGGKYPVTDVVQTGIIGSIALCLPNIQEGILIPVCLTGIKAGIDSLLSIENSFLSCLNESLTTGQQVGICDEIESVYLCDFFWNQALPLANMIVPSLLETAAGQNVQGGGEYLNVASAWTSVQNEVNYLVNSYGANSKIAFLERTQNISGNDVCQLFTSAAYPSSGQLLNTLTEPDSPSQFTARFDEIPFSTATNPPTSQYNVYYHIYAGQDSGAYYQVYLKGTPSSSYYQDVAQSTVVASGYIPIGSTVDNTTDFVTTSGYKQLCVNVNGQEDCGFQQVSTSFASNYIQDSYVSSEASQGNITTTANCVSGSASAYSLLNPNAQSAATQLANPAIYNQGIIRVCATANPGQGTDPYAGTANSRWQEVGYCDTPSMGCWIDTQSVSNVIGTTPLANETLNQIQQNYLSILSNTTGTLSADQFSSVVQQIQAESDNPTKISLINNAMGQVFWSSQKAELLYLRGNAYAAIFTALYAQLPKPTATTTTSLTNPSTSTSQTILQGLSPIELNIWQTAKNFADEGWVEHRADGSQNEVCARFVSRVLIDAGIKTPAIVNLGGTVNSNGQTVFNDNAHTNLEDINYLIPIFETSGDFTEVTSSQLQKGDIVIFGENAVKTQHITIFDSYSTDGKNINAFGAPGITDLLGKIMPAALQVIPINSNTWYFYKAFRYIGDVNPNSIQPSTTSSSQTSSVSNACTSAGGTCQASASSCTNGQIGTGIDSYAQACITALNGNSNAACCNSGTSSITTSSTATTSSSIGTKIYNQASSLVGSSESDIQLVIDSLTNSGITGFSGVSSISTLSSLLSSNTQLTEVNVSNLVPGDVVLIGQGCNIFDTVGIFSRTSGIDYYFYTDLNGQIAEDYTTSLSQISDSANNDVIYIYRAYRPVVDLTATVVNNLRPRWTVNTAITQVNNILTSSGLTNGGTYSDNQAFSDQLVFDGILTEQDCSTLRGKNGGFLFFGAPEEDMAWLKNLLVQKTANSGQVSSIQ